MATDAGNRAAVAALVAATVLLVPAVGYGGYAAGRELRDEDAVVALPSGPPSPTATPTLTATPSPSPAGTPTELSREARELASRATVRLSEPSSSWYLGSGSIVSPDGLVLTNAHVAQPTAPGLARVYGTPPEPRPDPDPEQIVVSTTTGDGPAEPTYLADVVAVDGHLDLAVLKISSRADGTPLPADLELPHVPIGSVDDLSRGDDLTVYGYPALNRGDRLTVRTGVVGAFLPDPHGVVPGDRYTVETTADFSGGNSGGMALSNDGRLVGVPSSVFTDDRVQAQAHNLRAVDLAAPLLEAARTGAPYRSPFVPANTGEERGEVIGWSGEEQCASVGGARAGGDLRDSGQTQGAARVWLGGFAPGEDVLVVLEDIDTGVEQVLATVYDPADPCVTMPLPVDDSGYQVPGTYLLVVLAGPDRTEIVRNLVHVEDVAA